MLDIIHYSLIILCLILTLIGFFKSGTGRILNANKKDAFLQSIALVFAITADYLLIFTDFYVVGILVFQGQHLTAILRYRKTAFRFHFIIAFLLSAISVSMLLIGKNYANKAVILAVLSYSILLISVTFYIIKIPQIQQTLKYLSLIGYILFIVCDINMALSFILPDTVIYKSSAVNIAWLFYFPAQLFLALSVFRYKK
ncbi:MAG: hypothetical protein LBD41_08330 [Clostridiales Family XIII bacterium]|jgi:hypothetical protein|nr:hypothetical protein [Clostridiales Family XIII bacterium]